VHLYVTKSNFRDTEKVIKQSLLIKMIAKQYINENIPVLKPSDTVDEALLLLNDYKLSHLPFVSGSTFEGLFSEDLLLNYDNDFLLSEIQPISIEIVALENDPLIEVVRKAYLIDADVLPVLNSDQEFVGIIEKLSVYQNFIGSLAFHDLGGLLEINLKKKDYSLAEIARLIENESGKIISLYITTDENNEMVLSLKLNITHISPVISALNRFGYEVISYHSSEPINNLEKDRFDLLMKYLSI
jgi:acetoin utilization protein AcuB